ncbi:hypothetical protein H6B13_04290 [Bacteroides gallinaceum]|uniref:hypothetical protein n=1 Tax=Bacteroides gallinaceum TaxID=1462571 RepID=UPI00195995A3|nr:hypothetical protein [Bacteroides gallinaceum]MBM6718861.1 hypothetical protein [Bacteroides gallinaceum]
MKKQYYLWQTALLMTGLFAGGCADETEGIALSGTPGEVIEFSVSRPQSRTIYLPEEGDGYAQIDWEGGEHIGIYCEQAPLVSAGVDQAIIEDEHDAEYIVRIPSHPNHDYHGDITANGNVLTWGTGEEGNDIEHFFYGAYPYERINWEGSTFEYPGTDNEKAIFSMKYITNQKCTIKGTEEDFGRIEHYVAYPDMSNAYMVARKPMWRTKDHVLLDFDPIMTTLDITIEAGGYEVATGIIQPLTITGVSVFMPKSLGVEYFCYDAAKIRNEKDENGTLLDQTFGELTSELHDGVESIHVQFVDENGNKVNIPLSEGETINLMAFLPPIPDEYTDGTKIKIHTAENFNFVATLNGKLGAQHKIHIKLPDIGPDAKINSNWISQLDPNIKLTQMSIPGYVCNGEEDFEKLLNLGIRAFDMNEIFKKDGLLGQQYKIPDEISQKFVSSVKSVLNAGEFVFIWVNHQGTDAKRLNEYLDYNFSGQWSSLTLEDITNAAITNFKGKIIPIKKNIGLYKGYFNPEDEAPLAVNGKRVDLFPYRNVEENTDIFNFEDKGKCWGVQFMDDDVNVGNKVCTTIENTDLQRGYTGIVTIPNIDWSDDNGAFIDYEKLIQAIIDCNYKFILDRN